MIGADHDRPHVRIDEVLEASADARQRLLAGDHQEPLGQAGARRLHVRESCTSGDGPPGTGEKAPAQGLSVSVRRRRRSGANQRLAGTESGSHRRVGGARRFRRACVIRARVVCSLAARARRSPARDRRVEPSEIAAGGGRVRDPSGLFAHVMPNSRVISSWEITPTPAASSSRASWTAASSSGEMSSSSSAASSSRRFSWSCRASSRRRVPAASTSDGPQTRSNSRSTRREVHDPRTRLDGMPSTLARSTLLDLASLSRTRLDGMPSTLARSTPRPPCRPPSNGQSSAPSLRSVAPD